MYINGNKVSREAAKETESKGASALPPSPRPKVGRSSRLDPGFQAQVVDFPHLGAGFFLAKNGPSGLATGAKDTKSKVESARGLAHSKTLARNGDIPVIASQVVDFPHIASGKNEFET